MVLKSLGLLVVMAISGLPVFAERAAVPPIDGVFVDIGDEQEISQNLSTFSSHLARIVRIINEAGRGSLVLLDELGAGTDPAEGGTLGYAILETLLKRGVKVLASTHLGVLKTFAMNHSRAQNSSMEFDPKTLDPLFSLFVGLPGSSNAMVIARRMGMPESLVSRAEEMVDRPDGDVEALVGRLQESRLAAEASRKSAEELESLAQEGLAALKERTKLLEAREGALEEEAGRRAHQRLRSARTEMESLLKPLLKAPGTHGERARALAEAIHRLLDWSPLADQRKAFLKALRKGDTVRVPRFRFRGPILRLDRKRERVTVNHGGLTMEVTFEDLVMDDEEV